MSKTYYLDNDYLSNSATRIHFCGTFCQQYVLSFGQFFHPVGGNTDDIVELVYEKEMLIVHYDSSFMGMWQLWSACNIILIGPKGSIYDS